MKIKLSMFEGPLDLLLHLIEKSEVDIYEVSIQEITNQYVNLIHEAKEQKLEIASEFLVMAATLLMMKSRMLLPRSVEKEETNRIEEEEWLDPREHLIERLLEYKKFKKLAEKLQIKETERKQVFTRPPIDLKPYIPKPNPVQGLSPDQLLQALLDLLKYQKPTPLVTEVAREEISVKDRIQGILDELQAHKRLMFSDLFSFRMKSKEWIITTFLALLELMKNRKVICYQHDLFAEIQIERRYD